MRSVRPEGPKLEPGRRIARYVAAWLAAALPAFLIITLLWLYFGRSMPYAFLAVGAFALTFPVMVRRLGVARTTDFVYFLLVAGLAFGVLSILTGWGNGLTDEPYTTPRFAGFLLSGHDPYTEQLVFTYQQYGQTLPSRSYYLYLPLLMFLQIPGVSYKWFALGCWALMVLLTRRRFDTAILLGQPYVLLIAASGYNDLVVLLLLTLGFVGIGGHRQKWAEYLSLGCKQFANLFVFVYYLLRRRWVDSAITLAVSAAFILPFVAWGGTVVVCRAVFADRLLSCPSGGGAALLLNYPVWLVWVVAVFYVPLLVVLRTWSIRPSVEGRLASWRIDRRRIARLPALAIVSASAVSVGLALFTVASVAFGPGRIPSVAADALATTALVAWGLAWNGPWRGLRGPTGTTAPSLRSRVLASQGLAAAVALVAMTVGMASGGPSLEAVAVGLSLGVVAGAASIWRWDLLDDVPSVPAGPAAGSSPGPSSGG